MNTKTKPLTAAERRRWDAIDRRLACRRKLTPKQFEWWFDNRNRVRLAAR